MFVNFTYNDSFEAVLNANEGKLIIDFWAPWCQPCLKLKEILYTYSKTHPDVLVVAIDIDQFLEVAQSENIRKIPTTYVLFGPKILGVYTKILSAAELDDIFASS